MIPGTSGAHWIILEFFIFWVPERDFKSLSNQLTSKVHPVTKPNDL